jgi:hypothetical protein
MVVRKKLTNFYEIRYVNQSALKDRSFITVGEEVCSACVLGGRTKDRENPPLMVPVGSPYKFGPEDYLSPRKVKTALRR